MWVLGLVINIDVRGFSKWAKSNESYAPIFISKLYTFLYEEFLVIENEFGSESTKSLFKPLGDGALFVFPIKKISEDMYTLSGDNAHAQNVQGILNEEDKKNVEGVVNFINQDLREKFRALVINPIVEAGGRADNLDLGIGISLGILKLISLQKEGKDKEKFDFFGNAINLSSRLCSEARPKGCIVDIESMPFLKEVLKNKGFNFSEIIPKDLPPVKVAYSPEVVHLPFKKPKKREDFQHHIEVHVGTLCFKYENQSMYVLIGKRKPTRSLYPGYWECGGGQVHKGETFEDAVKRQLYEEFGVKAEVISPLETYSIPPKGNRDLIPGIYFICRCIDDSCLKEESEEHDVIKWIKVTELNNYLFIPKLRRVILLAAEKFKELMDIKA